MEKHSIITLFFLLLLPSLASAQTDSLTTVATSSSSSLTSPSSIVTGSLYDRDSKEAVPFATVQVLRQDSSYVTGALSDDDGNFRVEMPEDGKYIVKVSSVGYKTIYNNVTIADGKDVSLGRLTFGADAVMLKGTTVTGRAAKVVVKEDTFQYNASASSQV